SALFSELRGAREADAVAWRVLRSDSFRPEVGLLVGLITGLAVGNQSHFGFGLLAGLSASATAGRAAASMGPEHGASQSWWASARARFDLISGTTTGLAVGLVYGLTEGTAHGVVAGVTGLFAVGLIVGFSKPTGDPAIDPYSSWRQDRERG